MERNRELHMNDIVKPKRGKVLTGFKQPKTGARRIKAELARQLAKHIEALGINQTAAAQRLGITQPDVSKLMRNRPTGFSTERLLTLLIALDLDIDIVLRPAGASPHAAKVRILEECA